MVTMVLVGSAALMLTMFLMRRAATGGKRDRDGIRWRGIDWSRGKEEPEEDRFKDSD